MLKLHVLETARVFTACSNSQTYYCTDDLYRMVTDDVALEGAFLT